MSSKGRNASRFFHFAAWLALCTVFLSAPAVGAAASGENPDNAHDAAAATYTLSLTATEPSSASGSSVLRASVTRNGAAAAGENVIFAWQVLGGSHQAQQVEGTFTTNRYGEVVWLLDNIGIDSLGGHRAIRVTATLQSDSTATDTADMRFGDLTNAGFIATSDGYMTWAAAQNYCAAQGGHLPLINGAASLTHDEGAATGSATIEGFGSIATMRLKDSWSTPWPSGLFTISYWAGTDSNKDYPGLAWLVYAYNGNVHLGRDFQEAPNGWALCVP